MRYFFYILILTLIPHRQVTGLYFAKMPANGYRLRLDFKDNDVDVNITTRNVEIWHTLYKIDHDTIKLVSPIQDLEHIDRHFIEIDSNILTVVPSKLLIKKRRLLLLSVFDPSMSKSVDLTNSCYKGLEFKRDH